MIRIKNVCKSFGNQIIFDHASLEISKPGLYALCGKSGCGKSTLLNLIAGFEEADSGSVESDADVMTIFQNYELIEEINIYQNIFLGRKPESEDKQLLKKLGIQKLMKQFPLELSGGQKQRVGIARALIAHPAIVCCDEPTESLDIENKQTVMEILKEYSKTHIVIMATHQMDTVDAYADTVIRIQNGQLIEEKTYVSSRNMDVRDERKIPEEKIPGLIGKIIRKRNRMFLLLFSFLMILAEATSIVRQTLFYVPNTTHTVNADMIYIETSNEELLSLKGLGDAEKIVRFNRSTEINGKEYQLNVYPYVSGVDSFTVTGDLPDSLHVLINQNAAEMLFASAWKEQEITVPFHIDPYVFDVTFTVCGVIEERDTDGLNLYYDLSGMKQYMDSVVLEDGRSMLQLFESNSTFYQKKTGYDRIVDAMVSVKSHHSIQISSPLYDERQAMMEQSQIYRYMFMAFTVILVLLLSIAVWVLTRKETEAFKKAFVILASQKVNTDLIRKCYLLKKLIPVILFTLLNLVILMVLQLNNRSLNLIPMGMVSIAGVMIQIVAITVSLRDTRQEKISQMLKDLR